MNPPTCEEIWNEDFGEPFLREDDATWRHGAYRTEVYYRSTDDTYWEVVYAVSTDGETNGLREGSAIPLQVEPYQKTVTAYRRIGAK